jgi:hypothetical protein
MMMEPPTTQSTPTTHSSESSTTLFSSGQKYRNETYTTMGDQMKKFIVGPMPPQAFLDSFFPTEELPDLVTVSSFKDGHYKETLAAEMEGRAYLPFVSQFS